MPPTSASDASPVVGQESDTSSSDSSAENEVGTAAAPEQTPSAVVVSEPESVKQPAASSLVAAQEASTSSDSSAEPHDASVDTEHVVLGKCLNCAKLQRSLQEEQIRAEEAEARISRLEAERSQMVAELEDERVSNRQAEAHIATLEAAQMDLCSVLEAALQSASDSSTAADDLVKARMAELAEKDGQISTLTTQLGEHRDKFAQQEATLKEQINEMQDRFGDQQSHLLALEEELSALTDSMARMTEKVSNGLHARWAELAVTELSQLATSCVSTASHSTDPPVQDQSAFGESLTSKIIDLEPRMLAFEALFEKFEKEVFFRLKTQSAHAQRMEATWAEQLALAQNDVQAVRSKLQRLEHWIQMDQESTAAELSRVKDEHSQEIEDLRLRHQAELARISDEHSKGVEDLRLNHQAELARIEKESKPVLLSKPQVADMIRLQAEHDGYPSVEAELIESLFAEFDSDKSGFFDVEARALARVLALRLSHQAELSRVIDEHKEAIAAIYGES